jgi:integrase
MAPPVKPLADDELTLTRALLEAVRKGKKARPPKAPRPPERDIIRPSSASYGARAAAADQYAREHLELEELQAFWAVVDPDPFWSGYFRLQYYFGCRCSEVAIIKKDDVDFKAGELLIRRLKKPVVGEALAHGEGWVLHRYPGVAGALMDRLRHVLDVVPKQNPWLFGSQHRARGAPEKRMERMARIRISPEGWRAVSRSSAQEHFKGLAAQAGIPEGLQHTHVLRHTRATLLFAADRSDREIQNLLGHSSLAITRKYIGWANRMKNRASVAAMLAAEDK